jgi:PAS domain S-box-containing protein
MANVADLIEHHREQLLSRFIEEAGRQGSARGLSRYEILDTLPEYLEALHLLCREGDREATVSKKLRLEETHISHRLRVGYNQEEATAEYLLLGRLISELWEALPPGEQPSPEDKQHLFAVLQGAMDHVVALFTGYTVEDRQAEKRTLRRLDALALELFTEGLSGPLFSERLTPLLSLVQEGLGADAAVLLVADATGERLVPAATTGLWSAGSWREPVALDSGAFVAKVAASDEPVYLPDATDARVLVDGTRHPGDVHSLLGLRMWPYGRLLGVCCIGQRRTRAFEPRARRYFEVLVEHLAGILEKALSPRPAARQVAGECPSRKALLDEERLRLAVESTGLGTWDYDPRTDVARWDERSKALFGLPPDARVDLALFLSRVHPEDRERTRLTLQEALRPGGTGLYSLEYRTTELPGVGTRWLGVNGRALFDASGQAVRLIGTLVDITARVREREAAERERHRVTAILETISDAFMTLDAHWRFTYVNREAERLLGQKREALLGRDHWEVFPGALGTAVERNYRRAAEECIPITFENYYEPWARWFELRVYPAEDGIAVYFHDITEKKQRETEREALLREQVRLREEAERALRERQRAVEVLERGDAVQVMDRDWRIVLVNENLERLAHVRREDILGRRLWEVYPDIASPESPYWREYHRAVEERVPVRFDAYYAPLDVWTNVSVYPTSEGGMAAFFRNETERMRAEQFRERLLGIVSHDLRNPLSNILMTTQLLLRREGVPDTVRPGVQRIATSADRMQRMISDLLDFTQATMGGGIPLARRPTSLCALAETTLEEFELTHPGRLVSSCARGMAEGPWDPDRLVQVVSNLVSNALAHGAEGTPVRVRVWEDGTDTCLSVHNEGPPIPEELLPRIFDPFKRATQSGGRKGLGLGLYIVQQVVLAHGGTIEVHSTREDGTTFTVRLPRSPG